jgi:hypothetical protein
MAVRSIGGFVAAVAALLVVGGCSSESDSVADVATTASVTPSPKNQPSPENQPAPTYLSCEELGPVFDRSEEYQRSFDPDAGFLIFDLASGAYRVDINDSECLAKYPKVAFDVADVLRSHRKNQRTECLSAIKDLTAPSSQQNEAARDKADLRDPAVRARRVTFATEVCAEVGIPISEGLH